MTILLLFVPFAALLILNLLPRSVRLTAAVAAGAVLLTAEAVVAILLPFGLVDLAGLTPLTNALPFPLTVDALSSLVFLCAGLAGLTALSVCRSTMKSDRDGFIFVNLLLIALIGMNGIAMVRDLFSLYVFIEVTATSTFILIAIGRGRDAFEGLWKYLILSFMATVFMLTGVALLLLFTGDITLEAAATAFGQPGSLAWVALLLYFCGLFVKAGLVPFHGWLADAYTGAPAAVSTYMAGVVTKASGILALMRVAQSPLGSSPMIRELLLIVGTVSAVAGAFLALNQRNMKRMLAYSSVSQMGYIVLALGAGSRLAIVAAALHFFVHSISKAQLFTNAAAIEDRLGTMDMDQMGGLAARMPLTGASAAAATLSVAGLPPLAGFWTKLLIVLALWRSGAQVWAVIAILTSVLTLAYFLSLQRRVFFGTVADTWRAVKEAGPGLTIPAVALAVITIGVGLGFPFLLPLILGGGS